MTPDKIKIIAYQGFGVLLLTFAIVLGSLIGTAINSGLIRFDVF